MQPNQSIIVEGPDGGGKSTLIRWLSSILDVPVHARAATSTGGPIANLAHWVEADLTSPFGLGQLWLYDRHPIISELVYGPITRNHLPAGFRAEAWRKAMIANVARRSIVVWCIPPLDVVMKNTEEDGRDMPGVFGNIDRIHAGYMSYSLAWPGRSITYDYTTEHPDLIANQLGHWIRKEKSA